MTLEQANIEATHSTHERKNYDLYARLFTEENCRIDATPKEEVFDHFQNLARKAFRKEQAAANTVNRLLVRACAEEGTLDMESENFLEANLYGQLDHVIDELREEGLI